MSSGSWWGCSVVKSACCSSRGPGFSSLLGNSQLPVTPAPGNQRPSSGLWEYPHTCTCARAHVCVRTHTHTHTHTQRERGREGDRRGGRKRGGDKNKEWRNGSAVKSICCSLQRTQLQFPASTWWLSPVQFQGLWHLLLTSAGTRHRYMCHTYMHAGKTFIHILKLFKLLNKIIF
jgi:hypothetical protein